MAWLTVITGKEVGGFGIGLMSINCDTPELMRSLVSIYLGKNGIGLSLLYLNIMIY